MRVRSFLACLPLLAGTCTPLGALPPDFSLDGRCVLVNSPRQETAGQPGTSVASFEVILTPGQSKEAYALRVAGPSPAKGWSVTINGKPLEISPTIAPDGFWYAIPAGTLVTGANHVQVSAPVEDKSQVTGLLGFSINPAEEERFGLWVAPHLMAPPAINPNQDLYDVQHMDIDITITPNSATIPAAAVMLTAQSLSAGLSQCVLDFNDNGGGMVISSVDSGPATPALTYSWNTSAEQLTINLASPVADGDSFTVRVMYSGTPIGAFRRGTHGGVPVIYTYNQPYDGREWYPCKDIPEDRFTLDVHATVPTVTYGGYPFSVVSNGTLVSVVPSGGNTIYNWQETYPITTQYVSLCCSNYRVAQGVYTGLDTVTTMPVAHHVYPESYASEAPELPRTIEVMEYFAQTFGEYPFLSEKYVTATWTVSTGMEHQTCTSMPNGNLATPYHRRNVHELFHMWFGDCLGVHTFEHLWLSEGWASYAESLWLEHKWGVADYKSRMSYYEGQASDAFPIVSSQADSFSYGVEYAKGAWVVHMLRRVVGDAVFFQSARNFLADTSLRYKTVVTSDYQAHVEALHGQSLQPFFDQWLLWISRPTYGFRGDVTSSAGQYTLNLHIGQEQGGATPFTMPLDIRLTDGASASHIAVVQNSAFSADYVVVSGTTRPLEIDLDPDNWVLCRNSVSINTVGLPPGFTDSSYSRALRATGGATPYVWTLRAGAPTWLSLNSGSGVLSGTPPAIGSYTVPVRVTDNNSVVRDTDLVLEIVALPPTPAVVINEVFFDAYGATDAGEYIELRNNETFPVDISGWKVVLVSSAGSAYDPPAGAIIIPASTVLASGDYYVIGNRTTIEAVYPGVVDLDWDLNNSLSNGPPAGIVLKTASNAIVDSITYRADSTMGGGEESSNARSEGGTGRVISFLLGTDARSAVLGRLPDGADTGSNLLDFANIAPSPGSANAATLTLPFADDFESGGDGAWRRGFDTFKVVAGGGIRPPAAGGSYMLEVYDSSGGGEVNHLPASHDRMNFSGDIWIPADNENAWSTGVGIASRNECAWFSNSSGYGIENGFYLEYQNGTISSPIKGGQITNHPGTMQLLAVSGQGSLNSGVAGTAVTVLGGTSVVTKNGWNGFRMIFDRPNNRLAAYVTNGGGSTTMIYDGVIPAGTFNQSGGVVVGFREQHSGSPTAPEATYVDNVSITDQTTTIPAVTLYDTEDFATNVTNPTPGGTTGWTPFSANQVGQATDYDAANEALRVTIATGSGNRINGWITANSEWMPYPVVGTGNYVRGKFHMFRSGQADMGNLNQVPNMRLRLATRFAVNSMLEVFNHVGGDVTRTNAGRELVPSTDPTSPSVYRVDFDPVDVPALEAAGEGIARGFEAYCLEPQENGAIELTESSIGFYPAAALPDSGPEVRDEMVFQCSSTDAGDLRVFNSLTDGPFYRKFTLVSPGILGGEVALDGSTDPTCTESSAGVTLGSMLVSTSRVGYVAREFSEVGASTERIRVEPARQYKIRWHVTSDTNANTNPQFRMRGWALKFMWSQKLEIGGALAAGNSNNAIAQQALPGVGTQNPDQQIPGEDGGWYTLLMHTPMSDEIQPTQSYIESQPGPGADFDSMRDIKMGADLIDTLSGSPQSVNESGRFTIDRIEVRSYDLVAD